VWEGRVGIASRPDWCRDAEGAADAAAGRPLERLRTLELFSGIGGLRAAFHRACDLAGVALGPLLEWRPLEASPLANEVYSRNFEVPNPPVLPIDISRVRQEEVDGADLWLMSPPCQPYTRLNARLDMDDHRASPLAHLVQVLPRLDRPPKALLLENVVGFETSESWKHVSEALLDCGYEVRQFQLSPLQLGIPNRRPRIYVLARRAGAFGEEGHEEVVRPCIHPLEQELPGCLASAPMVARTLSEYMDLGDEQGEASAAAVPRELLAKLAERRMPWEVVSGASLSSRTFTSGYGVQHYEAPRFGPLLSLAPSSSSSSAPSASPLPALDLDLSLHGEGGWREEGRDWRVVEPGEAVRYFTPSELLRIAGFPRGYMFPENVTPRQCYKLLGDSVNVDVIAHLLHFLLFEWTSLGVASSSSSVARNSAAQQEKARL